MDLKGEIIMLENYRVVSDKLLGDLYFPADDDVMAKMIEQNGFWEKPEIQWLQKQVKPGSLCLNVGANVGYFSALMAKLSGPSGKVIAIEPNPSFVPYLQKNFLERAHCDVELFSFAAGSTTARGTLFLNEKNFGDNRMYDPRRSNDGGSYLEHGFSAEPQRVEVDVVKLDDLFENENFDVVLIDTQGWDHEVIRGMKRILRRTRPKILLEFVPGWIRDLGENPEKIVQEFIDLGYHLSSKQLGLNSPSTPAQIIESMQSRNLWFSNLEMTPAGKKIKSFPQGFLTKRVLLEEIKAQKSITQSLRGQLKTSISMVANTKELINLSAALQYVKQFGIPETVLDEKIEEKDFYTFLDLLKVVESETELIRVGSPFDGGYVLPNIIPSIDACFSAGVEANSDFEFEIAKAGVATHLLDFSVDGPPDQHENFTFLRKYLTTQTSGENYISIQDWVNEIEPSSENLLLKMDIEGEEWRVLEKADSLFLRKFRVIVVEFHAWDRIADRWAFELMKRTIEKLRVDFDIVNVHPNNYADNMEIFSVKFPKVLELSFFRRDPTLPKRKQSKSSSPLNSRNNPNTSELELDEFWFSESSLVRESKQS